MQSVSNNKTNKLGNQGKAFAEALATVLLLQVSVAKQTSRKQPMRKDKNKAYVERKSKNDKN